MRQVMIENPGIGSPTKAMIGSLRLSFSEKITIRKACALERIDPLVDLRLRLQSNGNNPENLQDCPL
jgi:hypothetical protein